MPESLSGLAAGARGEMIRTDSLGGHMGEAESFNEHMELTGQAYRLRRVELAGARSWALFWRDSLAAPLAEGERQAATEAAYFVMGAAHQAGKVEGAQQMLLQLAREVGAMAAERLQ